MHVLKLSPSHQVDEHAPIVLVIIVIIEKEIIKSGGPAISVFSFLKMLKKNKNEHKINRYEKYKTTLS